MIYTCVDESYSVFVFKNMTDLLTFICGNYKRDGTKYTEKEIKQDLKTGSTVYIYDLDSYGDVQNDWWFKVEKHK